MPADCIARQSPFQQVLAENTRLKDELAAAVAREHRLKARCLEIGHQLGDALERLRQAIVPGN